MILPSLAETETWRVARTMARNPVAIIGFGCLGMIVLAAVFASWIFPEDPFAMVARPYLWPGQNPAFPLGTDALGRNVAAGIVYGARISLLVGLCAAALGILVGSAVGALAGYFGGRTDDLLVRLIEIVQTLPGLVLIVVVVAIAEPSAMVIAGAIGIITWPTIARLVRAEFRSLRQKEFVQAARTMGYGHVRIIFAEILPNALPPVIVAGSVMAASAILTESALSFMGLGDPNAISWGSMIGAGRESLRTAWYLTALPGLAIILTVLALNLIGDALNDALNPRLGGR